MNKHDIVFKYLVNKMLKIHNVDYDYVVNNQTIEDKPWFQHYTWTEEQEARFIFEAAECVRSILHCTKRRALLYVTHFIGNYGLQTIK